MARIVYGISGEGSGHSSRAREMMNHLQGAGHEVKAVSYDRGVRNLKDDFDVFEVEGLSIATVDNRVSVAKTFTENLAKLGEGAKRVRELRHQCFKAFDPHVVICDFEPTTAYLARHYDLPLISLDNQHRMRYMRYPRPAHLAKEALATEAVIKLIVPKPDVSLVTTFYFGELEPRAADRTFLFPPILRREVLDLEPSDGGAVLCYFTHGFEPFLPHLKAEAETQFIVYGYDRDEVDGNLCFKRASRTGFLEDLAACRAVIASAGFTLMTEALHLRKPYLALPMAGQFEQELNALLLEDMGCGMNGRDPGPPTVPAFLGQLDAYRRGLAGQPSAGSGAGEREPGNGAITAKLDELLADDCALARAFQRARS